MKTTEPSPGALIRPLNQSDRDRVLEISSQIWEGEDYVPRVIDDWMDDPDRELIGAEVDGVLATFGAMTRISPGEYWLEGLRGDSAYSGRGLGELLSRYFIQRAETLKAKSLRYATYFRNSASIHIGEKAGFRLRASFLYMFLPLQENGDRSAPEARASRVEVGSILRPYSGSTKEFLELVRFSPAWSLYRGLVSFNWLYRTLTEQALATLGPGERIYVTSDSGENLGFVVFTTRMRRKNAEVIGLTCLPPGRERALAREAVRLPIARGAAELRVCVPDKAEWKTAFRDTGFQVYEPCETNALVFEYPL